MLIVIIKIKKNTIKLFKNNFVGYSGKKQYQFIVTFLLYVQKVIGLLIITNFQNGGHTEVLQYPFDTFLCYNRQKEIVPLGKNENNTVH